MKKQLKTWKFINDSLERSVPVMLLYVLQSRGSSPGRVGFCMAVNANGETEGSIGGGIMEHKFVEMAKDKLRHHQIECNVYQQMHDKDSVKNQSGMICSGEQSNLMYTVQAKDSAAINKLIICLQNNKAGTLRLSPYGIEFDKEVPEEVVRFDYQGEDEKGWIYEERIGFKNELNIVGAGHCALALSKVAATLDFYINLYDDRENLETYFLNEFAHKKTIIKDYAELKNLISSGNNTYVVVMTVGYRTDDIVVRSLFGKEFKYFGVLGSQKKIEKMFSVYRQEGMENNVLEKIHAPAGLAIKSQTPEEIAISIVAEIIRVKNADLKG